MSKFSYFGFLFLSFSFLLCLSIWTDSRRMIKTAKAELSAVDDEIKKQEQRYLQALSSVSGDGSSWSEDLRRYESSITEADRRQIFSRLQSAGDGLQIDISNPSTRRLLDEMNGALNRISRIEQDYMLAQTEYSEICRSWQGRLLGCK